MDKWANKTVDLHRTVGPSKWLSVHSTVPHATFKLTRSDDIPGNGHCKRPRYELTYVDGEMNEFWRGIWLVEMHGTAATPVVHGLPEWKNGGPTQDAKWKAALDHISIELRAIKTNYTCLQGYMPVINDAGEPKVDRVRMMYFDQAITKDTGEKLDLVLVVLAYADSGSLSEDGAGSGPPR